jgi:hypothetical protein
MNSILIYIGRQRRPLIESLQRMPVRSTFFKGNSNMQAGYQKFECYANSETFEKTQNH